MACSRKQGKVLCFCVALHEEGRSRRKEEEAAEETRIVDCRQESNEGEEESERGVKRRELFLCLPPSSASAASPAAYSPRSLISRFLLTLHRTSPARGDGGEGSGCRVRFPISSSNHRRTKEKRMTEEEEEEEAKVEEPAVAASMEGKGVASGETNFAIDTVSRRILRSRTGIASLDCYCFFRFSVSHQITLLRLSIRRKAE